MATGTITVALKRLVLRRYIERRSDPADARRGRLHLTAKGRRIEQLRSQTVESRIALGLSGVRKSDRAAAGRVLNAIVDKLD